MSRRKPLIGTREDDQEVGLSGCSLLIGKAMETGAARNLRESHGTLRNKNKEVLVHQGRSKRGVATV